MNFDDIPRFTNHVSADFILALRYASVIAGISVKDICKHTGETEYFVYKHVKNNHLKPTTAHKEHWDAAVIGKLIRTGYV